MWAGLKQQNRLAGCDLCWVGEGVGVLGVQEAFRAWRAIACALSADVGVPCQGDALLPGCTSSPVAQCVGPSTWGIVTVTCAGLQRVLSKTYVGTCCCVLGLCG